MKEKNIDEKNLDLIRQIYIKSHESLDKAMLTLCSAALGISLTFYEKVYSGHALYLLILTWLCLSSSMLATLYSFITAAQTANRWENWTVNKEKYRDDEKFIAGIHRWENWTKRLNIISISGFTFGIFLFIIFATINTCKGNYMSDQREVKNGLTPLTSMMPKVNVQQKGTPPLTSTLPTAPKNGK